MTYLNQLFAVKIPYEEITKFCQRWKVKQFYLFGSVLRDDFSSESDIDVMVEFFPDASVGWKIVTMNDELEAIFKRQVDLTTKRGIEESDNWLRRKNILSSATLIYKTTEKIIIQQAEVEIEVKPESSSQSPEINQSQSKRKGS